MCIQWNIAFGPISPSNFPRILLNCSPTSSISFLKITYQVQLVLPICMRAGNALERWKSACSHILKRNESSSPSNYLLSIVFQYEVEPGDRVPHLWQDRAGNQSCASSWPHWSSSPEDCVTAPPPHLLTSYSQSVCCLFLDVHCLSLFFLYSIGYGFSSGIFIYPGFPESSTNNTYYHFKNEYQNSGRLLFYQAQSPPKVGR